MRRTQVYVHRIVEGSARERVSAIKQAELDRGEAGMAQRCRSGVIQMQAPVHAVRRITQPDTFLDTPVGDGSRCIAV